MTDGWTTGNATDDTSDTRGWLVGHFIDPSQGVRSSKDVEVKWANQRTTLVMLISGHFRVEVTGGGTTMTRQGDYIMWGPGIDHFWEAFEESVVLAIRWPSAT